MVVIGIKYFHQVPGQVFLLHRLVVFSFVEMIQLKGVDRFCIPDPQAVDYIIAVAYDRKVHRHGQHGLIAFLNKLILAVLVLDFHIAAEFDSLGVLRTAKLKGIAILQPHIRHFYLIAILNLLLEHSIAVTDAASICRISKACQRVQKTCSQTSQTAVSKGRIRLLVFDHIQIQSDLLQCLFYLIIKGQVDQIVAQCSAHQKLHGHIIYDLRVFFVILFLRRDPCIHNRIFYCIAYSLEDLLLAGFLDLFAEKRTYIILYASDKEILVKISLGHNVPPFTAFLHLM